MPGMPVADRCLGAGAVSVYSRQTHHQTQRMNPMSKEANSSQPPPFNEPAFPVSSSTGDPRDGVYCQTGMTLRDYFAAHETLADWDQPGLVFPKEAAELLAGPRPECGKETDLLEFALWEARWRAALRYIRADAMLAMRNQSDQSDIRSLP